MAYGFQITQLVEVWGKLCRRDRVIRGEKGHATGQASVAVACLHVHFHAITCGEDNQFLHLWWAKMRQGFREGRIGKCQTLTHRYRCCSMVQSDHNDRHVRVLHSITPKGPHKVCTKYDARTTTNPPTVARAALVP